jgi:c-di-GMP-binding flagellar brake protein YcgR
MATTAPTPTPSGIERRQSPRANAQFDVRYGQGAELNEAQVCDISATGIGLVGPKVYGVGDEIELRFRQPDGKADLLAMKAKVRHSTGQRMGLEFVNVPTSDHLRIRDMIKRLVVGQTTPPEKK